MKKTVRLAERGVPLKICVITYPFGKKTKPILLFNLLEILEPISDKLYVITGNIQKDEIPNNRKYHLINFKMEKELRRHLPIWIAFPIWIFNYIIGQLKMSYNLFKMSKNVDIVIFFLGYDYPLPILTAKILRKKTVMVATMSSKSAKVGYNKVFYYTSRTIEKIVYALSHVIIVYTENLIQWLGLEKHKNKISLAYEHFVDFDKFGVKNKFNGRKNLVGYIGRLSKEKGVLNFVKAIPEISKERSRIKFLIVGDGQLRDTIVRYLDEEDLNDKVKLTGWIPHDELSEYLNELKLVVLPSYTEGLPNIMLEAMACGPPVLATPVGAIPDVIKDGETGFIMENNSPECIAKNVIRALEHPDLEEIVENARALIKREFTYEAAVERYRKVLKELP
jgi:glycosyltransferase involved in cell wall biosynthesis